MFRWPIAVKEKGWVGVVTRGQRIDLAHVVREAGARPQIRLLDSYRIERDETDALVRLRAARKLQRMRCTTALGAGEYQFLQLEAAGVPEEERRNAFRWRVKDLVDFPVEQASIEVLDIPAASHGGGRAAGVFVAAAPAAVVAGCMKRFADAKLSLEAIDLPELAQRNVAALFEETNRGLAFLVLDEQGGLLTLTHRGELFAFRRIDISAPQLAEADPERQRQLLERVALELQRSLDTFDRQFSFVSVARLLVASTSLVEALQPVLADNLYLPVQLMDLAEVMEFSALPELRNRQRQAQCLAAIGIALREPA